MLIFELIRGSEYNHDWFVMVYAGLIYSYLSLLIFSIPLIVIGLPMSLIAKKHNLLNSKVILIGEAVLGAIFLSMGSALYFDEFNEELFWWALPIGAITGLLNGYAFFRRLIT